MQAASINVSVKTDDSGALRLPGLRPVSDLCFQGRPRAPPVASTTNAVKHIARRMPIYLGKALKALRTYGATSRHGTAQRPRYLRYQNEVSLVSTCSQGLFRQYTRAISTNAKTRSRSAGTRSSMFITSPLAGLFPGAPDGARARQQRQGPLSRRGRRRHCNDRSLQRQARPRTTKKGAKRPPFAKRVAPPTPLLALTHPLHASGQGMAHLHAIPEPKSAIKVPR
jgi:hypothetical protein